MPLFHVTWEALGVQADDPDQAIERAFWDFVNEPGYGSVTATPYDPNDLTVGLSVTRQSYLRLSQRKWQRVALVLGLLLGTLVTEELLEWLVF